ncbi:MAG: VWA domain-containing protein [Exiguobacterium profundum]|nr:MAG: VWA domain-containing protein [Exiguobacterium profundum]
MGLVRGGPVQTGPAQTGPALILVEDSDHDLGVARAFSEDFSTRVLPFWAEFVTWCARRMQAPQGHPYGFGADEVPSLYDFRGGRSVEGDAPMKRLAGLIAAAMVSVACFASQTEARVVAILFDTSGSMESIYRLPAFGMQLLAGTLDGRAGADRLLTLNFDTYANEGYSFEALGPANLPHLPPVLREAVRTYEISSQATHQSALDGIGADFRAEDANRGTPYGPIEIILGEAARAARPGEEVVIVVISDGEYNDDALAGGHAKPS